MRRAGRRRRPLAALVAIVAGTLPLVASPASAAATTLTVTSAADAGPGTLRQLLLDSEPLANDVTIRVPPGIGSITLTTGALRHGDGVGDTHRLRIEGNGQTITQTTPGARVLQIDTDGDSVVERLTITGGDAGSGACGGGISATGGLAVLSSVVTGNRSPCGGGGIFGGGTVAIIDSVVSDNDGGVIGGGVYAPDGWVSLERSTIAGNTAQFGGGILGSIVTPRSSTISGNAATVQGGGIYAGTVLLEASTVSGNVAGSLGGGILADPEGGAAEVELQRSTVAANQAPTAANIGAGSLSWWGSIVSGPGGGGANCAVAGAVGAGTSNLSDDSSCGTPAGATAAPALGPLADNGGPTLTHLPAATSPAVDAIATAQCGDAALDQRGFVRPTGAGCDIGAVEVGAAPVTRTFTGAVDQRWSHPGNWSPVGLPEPGADVIIAEVVRLDVVDVEVGTLTVQDAWILYPDPPVATVITVRGDVRAQGAATVIPPVRLPDGDHEIVSSGLHLEEVRGSGDVTVVGPGRASARFGSSYDGDIRVTAGARLDGLLGSLLGGTTLEAGSQLLLDGVTGASGTDVAEPLTVLDGPVPARLGLRVRSFTGPVELQGDLAIGSLPNTIDTNIGAVTGPISGPGALELGGRSDGTSDIVGTNTYGGGTTVAGRVGVSGSSPLGTGPVTMSATGRLDATGASLPNAISYPAGSVAPPAVGPFLAVAGSTTFTGPITVTGTNPVTIGLADGAIVGLGPGLSATSEVRLAPTDALPTVRPVVDLASPASIPRLVATDVGLVVGPGTSSIGDVDLVADALVPALRFSSNGQHVAASYLRSGGDVDLRGTEQTASALTVDGLGTLSVGRREVPVDPGRLTVNGPAELGAGVRLALLLAAGASDQLRASTVRLDGAVLDLLVDGSPAVGQVIRIVDNTGTDPVQGTFEGLVEGGVVEAGGQRFAVSYAGGTGNDVTLTRLAGSGSSWGFAPFVEHGGGMIGGPGISSWGPGRVDGWVVGLDRAVWHRYSQSGGGSGWESLGGIAASTPAAVSRVPGEVDVFVRGADDALWTRSYRGGWGPWTSLGGILTEAPSVASSSPSSLVVVVRGADGGIYMRRLFGSNWQGWFSLGGRTPNAPAVVEAGGNRTEVFVRGLDGALWQQTVIGIGPGTFQWSSLGGVLTHAPAAAAPDEFRVVVVGRGTDGDLWLRSSTSSSWSGWTDLGLPVSDAPGAARVAPGTIQIGIRSPTGSLRTSLGAGPSTVPSSSPTG